MSPASAVSMGLPYWSSATGSAVSPSLTSTMVVPSAWARLGVGSTATDARTGAVSSSSSATTAVASGASAATTTGPVAASPNPSGSAPDHSRAALACSPAPLSSAWNSAYITPSGVVRTDSPQGRRSAGLPSRASNRCRASASVPLTSTPTGLPSAPLPRKAQTPSAGAATGSTSTRPPPSVLPGRTGDPPNPASRLTSSAWWKARALAKRRAGTIWVAWRTMPRSEPGSADRPSWCDFPGNSISWMSRPTAYRSAR